MEKQQIFIPPPSYSFSISALITLALFYAKIEVDLFLQWNKVFLPITLFLAYKIIMGIQFFRNIQDLAQKVSGTELKLSFLWKITQILIFSSLIAFIAFLSQFLERLDNADDRALESFKHIAVIIGFVLAIYMGYSYTFKKLVNQQQLLLPMDKEEKANKFDPSSYILNFLFSLMGNTMSICAGGVCNSLYVSTISAFFSAFGVPIFEYIHYLNFLVYIFMGISLFSLYTVKHSVLYAPFLLSSIGATLIVLDMQKVLEIPYAPYIGNILLIGSAIWNSRLNKRRFSMF